MEVQMPWKHSRLIGSQKNPIIRHTSLLRLTANLSGGNF